MIRLIVERGFCIWGDLFFKYKLNDNLYIIVALTHHIMSYRDNEANIFCKITERKQKNTRKCFKQITLACGENRADLEDMCSFSCLKLFP